MPQKLLIMIRFTIQIAETLRKFIDIGFIIFMYYISVQRKHVYTSSLMHSIFQYFK